LRLPLATIISETVIGVCYFGGSCYLSYLVFQCQLTAIYKFDYTHHDPAGTICAASCASLVKGQRTYGWREFLRIDGTFSNTSGASPLRPCGTDGAKTAELVFGLKQIGQARQRFNSLAQAKISYHEMERA
jgi:hypothetical protein